MSDQIMSIGILSTRTISNSQKYFDIAFQSTETSIVHTFEDIPHQVTSHNNDFFVTTRSFRWPYAGWIVGFTRGE